MVNPVIYTYIHTYIYLIIIIEVLCTIVTYALYNYFVIEFNLDEFGKEYYIDFGPNSIYDEKRFTKPAKPHWRTAVIKDFIKKYESKQKTGETSSDDPDALVCIIPLMCYFAGKDDLIEKCKMAVEVMQTYKPAVNSALMATKIIEKYI